MCRFRVTAANYVIESDNEAQSSFSAKADAITYIARLLAKTIHGENRATVVAA